MRVAAGAVFLSFALALASSLFAVAQAPPVAAAPASGVRSGASHGPPPRYMSSAHFVDAVAQGMAGGGGYVPYTQAPSSKSHKKKQQHKLLPVVIKLSVGYDDQYRQSAWLPVRIALHNRSSDTLSGTVEIPDRSNGQIGPPQPFHALYQAPVVLPAGVTKHLTLYVPGSDVQGYVDVQLRSAGTLLGDATDDPSTFGQTDLGIGALTSDPANVVWLKNLNPPTATVNFVRLTPAMLDSLPQALANLDIIVLTDGSTAHLDSSQLAGLDGYVRNGGALLLVGGPNWQESLKPLPPDLIPGTLTGSRPVPDLLGLLQIKNIGPPKNNARTVVSVLSHPSGMVLASEGGVPLAVQSQVGSGHVLYLGFDPSLDPVPHWHGMSDLLTRLVDRAAPGAVSRSSLPPGFQPGGGSPFFSNFGPPLDIAGELSNVPAAALPSIILFVVLTVLYILLLGPINFLILRRLKRRTLAWVTIPAGAVICVAATFGVAFHLKGNTVLLNTAAVVQLDGTEGPHPAALYVGLFAPVRGDYRLTYNGSALPSAVPTFSYGYGPGGPPSSTPLGLRFLEGAQTQVQFLSMNMWSMRTVALHSMVNVTGTVRDQLHVDKSGYIVGAVHNDTRLTLIHPAIIAGRTVVRLRDMPPEATIPVRIKPTMTMDGDNSPIWNRVYGQPQYGNDTMMASGLSIFSRGPGGFGQPQCCYYGPGVGPERSLTDRLRNTVDRLPEAQNASTISNILFVAWNQQPLGNITVDGVTPQRRDLNLIMEPLPIQLPSGPFLLRPGTVDARLIDVSPQQTNNGCCGPTTSPVYLGSGGWATFQLVLPRGHSVHFKQLNLYVNAGGAFGADIGRLFDWRKGTWVHVDLSTGLAELKNPDRFVGPQGTLLLNLRATDDSGDIRIGNPLHDLQLAGEGVAA